MVINPIFMHNSVPLTDRNNETRNVHVLRAPLRNVYRTCENSIRLGYDTAVC